MESDIRQLISRALNARRNGEYAPIVLPGADLSGSHLDGSDFSGASLSKVSLTVASLAGANLERANLSDASLHACDLAGADLTEANLQGADLSKANIDDAVLVNTDLRGAFLRGLKGEPLSMSGALLDQAAVRRSGLSEAEVAQFLNRGAVFDTPDSIPPSIREAEVSRVPSIVPRMRQHEIQTRHLQVDEDLTTVPASRRAFQLLTNLIEEARGDEMPVSLRSISLPMVSVEELTEAQVPEIGKSFLGFIVDGELSGASVARTFVGHDTDGNKVLIKSFDPFRYGASLNLPAFQRGLRAMNRVLRQEGGEHHMIKILANATDLTAYVCQFYHDKSIEEIVDVNITLDAGLNLFEKICKSFSFIHKSSCLVRSLKPSNILLEGLTPRIAEIDMVDLPTVAQSSPSVCGYGSFVAPEELARLGTRSPTADVFAVGKLLEYLLTGRDPIAPLTGPSVLESREDVPKFLVDLVKRCTAPDPADRFQYVDEIIEEIETFRQKGAGAALRQAMRVRSISRIQVPPSLTKELAHLDGSLLPSGPRSSLLAEEEAEEFVEPSPSRWPSRRQELGFGVLGFLIFLGAAGLVVASPSNVDSIERFWLIVAVLGGFSMWLLPRLRRNLVPYRLTAWLAGAWLVYFFGPLPLAQLRWTHDLKKGDRLHKERALVNLARTGRRSFVGANLSQLTFKTQDLSMVNFSRANLKGSDLTDSFLRDSNFEQADLADAMVYGADLRASQLEGAEGLESLRCDENTLFPEGFFCSDGKTRKN